MKREEKLKRYDLVMGITGYLWIGFWLAAIWNDGFRWKLFLTGAVFCVMGLAIQDLRKKTYFERGEDNEG